MFCVHMISYHLTGGPLGASTCNPCNVPCSPWSLLFCPCRYPHHPFNIMYSLGKLPLGYLNQEDLRYILRTLSRSWASQKARAFGGCRSMMEHQVQRLSHASNQICLKDSYKAARIHRQITLVRTKEAAPRMYSTPSRPWRVRSTSTPFQNPHRTATARIRTVGTVIDAKLRDSGSKLPFSEWVYFLFYFVLLFIFNFYNYYYYYYFFFFLEVGCQVWYWWYYNKSKLWIYIHIEGRRQIYLLLN